MTFQNAIDFKRQFGSDQITEDNTPMRILVTPADHDDFIKYITYFRNGHFTDITAKQYSLNK